MQAPLSSPPWSALWSPRPSLGTLLDLCEENYRLLLRLIPDLEHRRGRFRAPPATGGVDLYLEILEQTPYTTLLHLTHRFEQDADPDVTLRAYHDAAQLEVVDLRQSRLPPGKGPGLPNLERHWRLNLFMSKWLRYCVDQERSFIPEGMAVSA